MIDWERLARAETHPIRVAVIEKLSADPREGGWSPNLLSRELGVPLGDAAYHVKKLRDAGLLVLVGTRQRRGALEHFYALAPA
jgi:DNA-binding transcriptional ArsR family regulator